MEDCYVCNYQSLMIPFRCHLLIKTSAFSMKPLSASRLSLYFQFPASCVLDRVVFSNCARNIFSFCSANSKLQSLFVYFFFLHLRCVFFSFRAACLIGEKRSAVNFQSIKKLLPLHTENKNSIALHCNVVELSLS